MANDLNRHECIGRLGKEPEVKYMPNGKAVTNINVAMSSSWKDQQGNKQEATEWVTYVAFDKLAEIMGEYLKKGSKVYLSGRMRTRKWQAQDGTDRYTTEIVASEMQMLDGRGDNAQSQPAPKQNAQPAQQPQNSAPAGFDDFSDDIPFS